MLFIVVLNDMGFGLGEGERGFWVNIGYRGRNECLLLSGFFRVLFWLRFCFLFYKNGNRRMEKKFIYFFKLSMVR